MLCGCTVEDIDIFIGFRITGAEYAVKFNILSVGNQPVFQRTVVGVILIIYSRCGGFQMINPGHDVVFRAAGKGLLVPFNIQKNTVVVKFNGEPLEPVRNIDAARIADVRDIDAAVGYQFFRIEVQDEIAFVESRITRAEVTVENRFVNDGAGKIQPVLRHAVVLTKQISAVKSSLVFSVHGSGHRFRVRRFFRKKNAISNNIIQHGADRHPAGGNLF